MLRRYRITLCLSLPNEQNLFKIKMGLDNGEILNRFYIEKILFVSLFNFFYFLYIFIITKNKNILNLLMLYYKIFRWLCNL